MRGTNELQNPLNLIKKKTKEIKIMILKKKFKKNNEITNFSSLLIYITNTHLTHN